MRRLIVGVTLAGVLTASACGAGSTDSSSTSSTLTVFAAASLTSTFTEIGAQFEADNPGVAVRFNFAGSSDLVAQLQQGAPADVFASADATTMDKATRDDLIDGAPTDFATNTLEIATPPDNPAKITSLADLAGPAVKIVLCAPAVPCGSASQKVERASGTDISPVSEEQSVTDVLNKVASGEADAGLVYVTDVRAAGDKVTGIVFPESAEAVNTYPIAALAGSANSRTARAFVAYVAGPQGQAVLAAAGFAKP